ncbi:DUF3014 domain-containing protein [Variovorax dokdonensis]|uniref:DUF3014 domain-containing protein n=1 Tax=Variovorax dokdonensis TaxID=344883 RepID=A0ABT7NE15_9BURK|nr:DUF3014 domain-containing protein [Variovorax dokdonensis]MDM0046070.1 DUF3014 domain-containing protein [Variovorax dokdonensis]
MAERDPRQARRHRQEPSIWIYVVLILLLLIGAFIWWRWPDLNIPGITSPSQREQQSSTLPAAPPDMPPQAPAAPPSDMPLPGQQQAGTPPLHPIQTPPDANLPRVGESDPRVTSALNELIGKKSVGGMLQVDGFIRRFVATVDNLPREYAPSRMWPVQTTAPQFMVSGEGDSQVIAADNAGRYTPMVLLAESVDAASAARLYFRLYPLFQEAYEELGYGSRYFNDRLVAVIDHLLSAPEPTEPVRVTRVEVKSDVPMSRPWAHYEFADPRLESMSAGQKIMVRMGLVNERRMKARLRAFRAQILAGGAPAAAPASSPATAPTTAKQ